MFGSRYLFAVPTALLAACSIGVVTQTTTLAEPPFLTVAMPGSVTDAARCVGRYWQAAASEMGLTWNLSGWNVYTDSYQVQVTGPQLGPGAPPIGAVIKFDETGSKTLASAHVHRIFPSDDPRRMVTAKALEACRESLIARAADTGVSAEAKPTTHALTTGGPTISTQPEPSGSYLAAAERLAQTLACGAKPRFVAKGSGYETYSLACSSGDPMMLRCDSGSCREMK